MKLSEEERKEMRILFRRASILLAIGVVVISFAIIYFVKTH